MRLRPVAKETAQAVVVRPRQIDAGEAPLASSAPVSWSVGFEVECYARATPSQAADEAVDGLLAAVYARLMTDQTLGGSVLTLAPQGLAYEFDVDGEHTVSATFPFTARQTRAGATF